jgi:hypothetical protein
MFVLKFLFMDLFKYGRVDKWLLASLNEGTIHLNCPTRYNDPFDCYMNLAVGNTDEYWNNLKGQHPTNEIDIIRKVFSKSDKNPIIQPEVIKSMRITCFSECETDLLMWGHYADCHQGICLKFETLLNETNAFLFDRNDFTTNYNESPFKPLMLYKVNYPNEMTKAADYFSFNEEDVIRFISTKAHNWHYEKEWRIMSNAQTLKTDNPRYFDKQLKAIIFGMNCPTTDVNLIKKLTSGRNLEYFKAEISLTEFKVEIKQLSE